MIDIDVASLLPHEGSMMLLDRVIKFDQDSMETEVVVRDDGLFGDKKTVPAWLGIEYMAQTVAAHDGMMCVLAGKPVRLGFLLGTRRYNSNIAVFKVGTVLTVRVEKFMQDQGFGVFFCQILAEGVDVSAKMNVYHPNKVKNLAAVDL
jgi:predicted hotdog family 3-hydroxylacyl-ACP dehydratase